MGVIIYIVLYTVIIVGLLVAACVLVGIVSAILSIPWVIWRLITEKPSTEYKRLPGESGLGYFHNAKFDQNKS
jgi:hypothetical protein